MRLLAARSVAALALALAGAACDTPPPVAPPKSASLDAEDFAVMRGVLNSLRRPAFLVVDTTLTPCPVHPPRTGGTPTAECLSPGWRGFVSRLLPSGTPRTGLLAFDDRNRDRLPVTGALGSDVKFISATAIDFLSSTELLASSPAGSAIVTFSAPFYTAPGVAVIAYGLHQEPDVVSAARLDRHDGQWVVASSGQYDGVY